MIERLIENWLDKANERTYQIPFCHMLSNEGYTVLHLTRHCAMELGKDILAVDPDGMPCAYQLKTTSKGKISLRMWRKELNQQMFDLVAGAIEHPSIDSSKPHKAFLVTNRELEEEVIRAIGDMNNRWAQQGQPQLKLDTIVRGDLIRKAQALETNLWPSELRDVRTLLQLFLENGQGQLPKEKLSSLFEAMSPVSEIAGTDNVSSTQCSRILASSALLCAIAISSFSNQRNHAAEIEAWTLYVAYLMALVEGRGLPCALWNNEFEIAATTIYNCLSDLCSELKERGHFVEGHPFADAPLYRIRMTYLVGLMSVYAFFRQERKETHSETDEFIRRFCLDHKRKLYLWGEAAIPQLLAFYWYFRTIDATLKPMSLITELIRAISIRNRPGSDCPLANPYYAARDILPYTLGVSDQPLEDRFDRQSYALEGLVHLFVRQNWKQTMKLLWPDVTRLAFVSFEPRRPCDFFRWRSKNGTHRTVLPRRRQEWTDLKCVASESQGQCLPASMRSSPALALLFLLVYPHRMNAEILRWLDAELQRT